MRCLCPINFSWLIVALEMVRKVRVYQLNLGTGQWSQVAELSDPSGQSNSKFGKSVSIKYLATNSYLYAVGAPGNSSSLPGAVMVFKEEVGTINATPLATLVSPVNPSSNDDEFGYSVKFFTDFLAVGSPGADISKTNGGALIVFQWGGGFFLAGQVLAEGGAANDVVGRFVTATVVPSGAGIPMVYANHDNKIIFCSYDYLSSSWGGPQISTPWSGAAAMVGLDAFGTLVVASEGSKIAYSVNSGVNFSSSVAANVSSLAIVADLNASPTANIGTFVVNVDPSVASKKVDVRKLSGSTLYLKQSLLGGVDLGVGSGIVGRGRRILIGNPGAGKIQPFE
jgi:hypothetical protein